MRYVADQKERLDRFLVRHMTGHSRTKLVGFVQEHGVTVEGERVTKAGFELKPGWTVEVGEVPESEAHALSPVAMDLDIRFEDEHVLVVNKPRGLTVHPAASERGATLVHGLLARSHGLSSVGPDYRPGIVHRLDKETTGLLVVAKTDEAHWRLAEQVQAKSMERRYVARVYGSLGAERMTLDGDIGRHPGLPTLMAVVKRGRPAVTHVQVLAASELGTLVACRLETGRTHQIRVHLATYGHPVKGDSLYAKGAWKDGPMQLHAAALGFAHPISGERLRFFVSPPADFEEGDVVVEEEVWAWT